MIQLKRYGRYIFEQNDIHHYSKCMLYDFIEKDKLLVSLVRQTKPGIEHTGIFDIDFIYHWSTGRAIGDLNSHWFTDFYRERKSWLDEYNVYYKFSFVYRCFGEQTIEFAPAIKVKFTDEQYAQYIMAVA